MQGPRHSLVQLTQTHLGGGDRLCLAHVQPAEARAEHARPPLQIDLPETQSRESTQSGAGPSDQTAIEAAADSVPTGATSAGIPLPNAVIARTIGRIGYPCGEVASTTAMEGTAGVFKVTCTSGHSYRAAPVRGRYRFRRLG